MIPSLLASGSRHVVMLSILSLVGCFMRSNGGCQTPCSVISACAVAETALASTPPSSDSCGGVLQRDFATIILLASFACTAPAAARSPPPVDR